MLIFNPLPRKTCSVPLKPTFVRCRSFPFTRPPRFLLTDCTPASASTPARWQSAVLGSRWHTIHSVCLGALPPAHPGARAQGVTSCLVFELKRKFCSLYTRGLTQKASLPLACPPATICLLEQPVRVLCRQIRSLQTRLSLGGSVGSPPPAQGRTSALGCHLGPHTLRSGTVGSYLVIRP